MPGRAGSEVRLVAGDGDIIFTGDGGGDIIFTGDVAGDGDIIFMGDDSHCLRTGDSVPKLNDTAESHFPACDGSSSIFIDGNDRRTGNTEVGRVGVLVNKPGLLPDL